MKISLNLNENGGSEDEVRGEALQRLILATRNGDIEARDRLIQLYMPLLQSLAGQRAQETAGINEFIEAGKQGLVQAARKFKASAGPEQFRFFAIDHIEKAMDGGGQGGFLRRLFGR